MDEPRTATLREAPFPIAPTADPAWCIEETGFNLAREHEIESLFAIANGYVGSRGSLAEGSALSDPATFIAGVYDTVAPGAVPELAAAPDWMRLEVHIDGGALRVDGDHCPCHRRILDLRQGIYWRELACRVGTAGLVRLRGLRLASLADRHLLLQTVWLTPEHPATRLRLRIAIEPALARPGRARLYPQAPAAGTAAGCREVELRPREGRPRVAVASRARLWADGLPQPLASEPPGAPAAETWCLDVEPGRDYRLDRLVVIHTSRDHPRPRRAAARHLAALSRRDPETLVAAHVRAWAERWGDADLVVEGDAEAQRALRFAAYHLIGAANPKDERVSIGARALTGGAYKGHVFWDTEIFMLPFFLLTQPAAARALLMYRWHSLPAARVKARRLGYRGALYAWESTDDGAETTPARVIGPEGRVLRVLNGELEQHISADVAYAVQQYWDATADADFMWRAGAEILLETARFWASRGRLEADGRFHLRGVIGPDEYHENVDDDAYTNGMAQWNLECAARTAARLAAARPERWRRLALRLRLEGGEPERWRDLAGRMYFGCDSAGLVFEQFAGYFGLEDIDRREYAGRTAPPDVTLGRERVQGSRIVKQAAVLMLIYLLWERFPPASREANFRYYEPRTAHGSSLSPAIHAALAARLGDGATALRYFHEGGGIDLGDNMGNAAGGVHAAALGGLWQAAVFGFAGVGLAPEGPRIDPCLPPGWTRLRFALRWRGGRLRCDLRPDRVELAAEGEKPLPIRVGDAPPVLLAPGEARSFTATERHWRELTP